MNNQQNGGVAVVGMAKLRHNEKYNQIVLSTGYSAVLSPVSASIIDEASSKLEYPEVPVFWIESKEKSEPNPNDPAYIKDCAAVDQKRALAGVDAMIMFGLELVTEEGELLVIEQGRWLKKLQLLERMGSCDLSQFDLDNAIDLDFIFKKYVAVAAPDIATIASASGVSEDDVQQAQESFRGDTARE